MSTDLVKVWRDLFNSETLPPIEDMLSESIQMHSPVMHTPQTGKKLVSTYIVAAHKLFNDWNLEYIRDFQKGREVMLEFEGEINGMYVNGVDIIRWDESGKIEDFKILFRPLKALEVMAKLMVANRDE